MQKDQNLLTNWDQEGDVGGLVTYLRVSTSQQGKSGLGIEAQREALARFAQAEGLDIVAEPSRRNPVRARKAGWRAMWRAEELPIHLPLPLRLDPPATASP